jgi:hypothetical protein
MGCKERKVLFGFDESNHGANPEVFSLVSSPYPTDIETVYHKLRGQKVLSNLYPYTERDMRYCVLSRGECKTFGLQKPLVHIIPFLFSTFPIPEEAELYIDGALNFQEIDSIKKKISYQNNLSNLEIICIPKLRNKSKTVRIIAIADGIANYIFRQEKSTKNRVNLSKFLHESKVNFN